VSEPVTVGEFTRAFEALSRQLADLQTTGRQTLAEARKTNGRVNGLEAQAAEHGAKLRNLEREVFHDHAEHAPPTVPAATGDNAPITRRELYIAVVAFGAAFGVLFGLMRLMPALMSATKVAP